MNKERALAILVLALSHKRRASRVCCRVMGRTVLIERKGDNRLYNTESMSLVSLSDLADMLVNGLRIIVEDAETGEDVTSEILDRLH